MQSPSTPRPVILIVPPVTTPEHPLLSIAALAGFLRSRQLEVFCQDYNVEACHALLAPEHIDGYVQRIRSNIPNIPDDRKKGVAEILASAGFLKENLDYAKNILRDRNDFYDPEKRRWALRTLQRGMAMVSAAYFPARWRWVGYDCAYRPDVSGELLQAANDRDSTPFTEFFQNQIENNIIPHSPILIGISVCYVDQVIPAFCLLRLIKEMVPDVHCAVGGGVFTRLVKEVE